MGPTTVLRSCSTQGLFGGNKPLKLNVCGLTFEDHMKDEKVLTIHNLEHAVLLLNVSKTEQAPDLETCQFNLTSKVPF